MKFLSKRLHARGVEWDPDVNFINCMNHVLNLSVQDFVKLIKAVAPDEDKTQSLQANVDDNESDLEIDDDSGDEEGEEEEEEESEELLTNEATIEAEEDYDDVTGDFAGIMKKLRGVAKVRDVAYKMIRLILLNHFCMLQLSFYKLTSRKRIQVLFKKKTSDGSVYSIS
jgi:hypothetical protein